MTPLAKALSIVFQPLLTGLYLVVGASLLGASTLRGGMLWALVVVLVAVGLPALDIARRVRTGRAGDFQLALREERLRPLAIAILCAGLALLLVAALGAPRLLLVTLLTGLACGLVLTAVTSVWKISFHSGALAAAAVLAGWYGGPSALLLLPLLAAVGWSRVWLGRHTVRQVIAGALLASLISVLVLFAFREG